MFYTSPILSLRQNPVGKHVTTSVSNISCSTPQKLLFLPMATACLAIWFNQFAPAVSPSTKAKIGGSRIGAAPQGRGSRNPLQSAFMNPAVRGRGSPPEDEGAPLAERDWEPPPPPSSGRSRSPGFVRGREPPLADAGGLRDDPPFCLGPRFDTGRLPPRGPRFDTGRLLPHPASIFPRGLTNSIGTRPERPGIVPEVEGRGRPPLSPFFLGGGFSGGEGRR